MSEPTIQAASLGCPYCPTRVLCGCPDGPERCPDNADCPCDKTVCPCGKHAAKPPPPEQPPGCRWPVAIWLAPLVLVILVLGGFGLRSCLDDDEGSIGTSDTGVATIATTEVAPPDTATGATDPVPTDPAPPPETEPPATDPPATDPPATDPPATTTTVPAPRQPTFDPPVVDQGDVDAINELLFAGVPVVVPPDCRATTRSMGVFSDSLGGLLAEAPPSAGEQSPVFSYSFCFSTNRTQDEVDLNLPEFHIAVIALDGPPVSGFQPGLGIGVRGGANPPDPDADEGILLPGPEFAIFPSNPDVPGWSDATIFEVPGFAVAGSGAAFVDPAVPFVAFAWPTDLAPPGSQLYYQGFFRDTPEGLQATPADPTFWSLWDFGVISPCVGACPPEPGRFVVEADFGGPDTALGAATDDGSFWFLSPDDTELVVKVLDACTRPDFGSFWVFAGGLTDVEVTLTVVDTQVGESRSYANPSPFEPILDTDSFATCP